jgi:SHS2 domain-containing protein
MSAPCDGFEELEHTADIAVRAHGATLGVLFANAARGMMALAGVEVDAGAPQRREIALDAPDVETLLVDWLSELVYCLEDGVAYVDYDARATETRLQAAVSGGRVVEVQRHIKAVTYHNLRVDWVGTKGCYETTVVFDV